MKQPDQNFWNMVKDTLAFFFDNTTEWITNVILKKNVELLETKEAELALANQTQKEKDTRGSTTQKGLQLKKMTQLAYKLGCKLTSFALETGDKVLLGLVNFSLSDLGEGTEIEVITRCQIIADRATFFLPQLTDYTVTAGEITLYQTEIDKFKKMPAERDLIANQRKTAVKSISQIVAETRELFEKIDNNVDGFIENETFVAEYHQMRAINNRGEGSSTPQTPAP